MNCSKGGNGGFIWPSRGKIVHMTVRGHGPPLTARRPGTRQGQRRGVLERHPPAENEQFGARHFAEHPAAGP